MSTTMFSGGRLQRWLLAASLCLNAVLGGYVAAMWMKPERPFEPLAGGGRVIERVAARLPPEDADILRQVYRNKQSEFADARENYVRALVKPVRLLRQEHLDVDELRKALSETREKRQRIGDLVTETFVESAGRMSLQGRRKLVGGVAMR